MSTIYKLLLLLSLPLLTLTEIYAYTINCSYLFISMQLNHHLPTFFFSICRRCNRYCCCCRCRSCRRYCCERCRGHLSSIGCRWRDGFDDRRAFFILNLAFRDQATSGGGKSAQTFCNWRWTERNRFYFKQIDENLSAKKLHTKITMPREIDTDAESKSKSQFYIYILLVVLTSFTWKGKKNHIKLDHIK